jgi:hypothetical protein
MVTEVAPPSWRSSPRMPIWRRGEGWSRQSMAYLLKGSNYPEILGPFLNWFGEAGYVGRVELNACVGIREEGVPRAPCCDRRRGRHGATRSHITFFNTMRVRPEPFLAENVVGRS